MKHRALIGIEISPDEIRGAHVRMANGIPQLAGVASVPTPQGAIDAEGVLGSSEVGDAIRRVCAQLDPRTGHVVIGMTVCNLVARVMEIPPVPDSEVRAVLRGEMDHYRILPAGQSAFDFYRLPEQAGKEKPAAAEGAEPVARVLLMGAEERLVASYRAAVDAANMNLVAVEPGAIAIMRALQPVLRVEHSVATVIVGAAGTDIFITQEGALQFYRRIDTGIPELLAQAGAVEQRQVTGAPQMRGGMLGADDEEPVLEPAVAAPAPAADPYNRQAISLLMTEVQRSLDYFSREFPLGEDSMSVRFALDASDAPEMFAVMAQYLRSDAEMASALTHLGVSDEARMATSGSIGYRYNVAVGLALRGAEGEFADAPELDLGIGDRVIIERRVAPRTLVASAAASGLIFVGTIAAALVVGNRTARLNQKLAQETHELKELTQQHAAKVAMLNRQKDLVTLIHGQDKPMREAIEFLSAAVSRHACLTTLTIDSTGKISLGGEAMNSQAVADIMDIINLAPTLEPIRLNNIMRVEPDKGGKTFKFDMQTGLMNPIVQAALPAGTAPAGKTPPVKGGS
jgi:Tfp pilus assembly PilM family ATPase/Tfp pilus assembly protein PilN